MLIPENDVMILSIDISPDCKQMVSVNNKGTAYIWSLSPGNDSTLYKIKKKNAENNVINLRFQPHHSATETQI